MLAGACIREWQGLAPDRCSSIDTPRNGECEGRTLALRGFSFSAYEIRLIVRHARALKRFAGYAKSNNWFVRVENENGASSRRGVCSNRVEASLGVSHGENFAVESVLNGLPIVNRSLDYDEGRDLMATEPAEIVNGTGVSRLERSNSTYSSSEDAGAASLDCVSENGHGMAELGLDDFEYYVPEIGHRVLGVVVSGSRTKFDVDIGAAKLGELKVSKLFPLDRFQVQHNRWICPEEGDADDARGKFLIPPHGRPCMVYDEEVFAYEDPAPLIIDIGTVLELVVIGMSLSGNPILSAREAGQRIAWERVKQVNILN